MQKTEVLKASLVLVNRTKNVRLGGIGIDNLFSVTKIINEGMNKVLFHTTIPSKFIERIINEQMCFAYFGNGELKEELLLIGNLSLIIKPKTLEKEFGIKSELSNIHRSGINNQKDSMLLLTPNYGYYSCRMETKGFKIENNLVAQEL